MAYGLTGYPRQTNICLTSTLCLSPMAVFRISAYILVLKPLTDQGYGFPLRQERLKLAPEAHHAPWCLRPDNGQVVAV